MEIGQNETQMGQWLLQNGPISVGLNANAMQFYRGGGTPAPRTPDTRGRSDTSRAATMRTGDRWAHIRVFYTVISIQ